MFGFLRSQGLVTCSRFLFHALYIFWKVLSSLALSQAAGASWLQRDLNCRTPKQPRQRSQHDLHDLKGARAGRRAGGVGFLLSDGTDWRNVSRNVSRSRWEFEFCFLEWVDGTPYGTHGCGHVSGQIMCSHANKHARMQAPISTQIRTLYTKDNS